MDRRIDFQAEFGEPPVVVANALQGLEYAGARISDSFAVTIVSVSTDHFVARIHRVDVPAGGGWGQQLQLGWMATVRGWDGGTPQP
jgi:hypothetical protein